MTAAAANSFNPTVAYRVGNHVVLRPEAFGALAYDLNTTRLLVLRDRDLVTILDRLGEYDSVVSAVEDLAPSRQRTLLKALAGLERGGLIHVS